MVGVQLFLFLSLHKPCTYPPSFLVLFHLMKFQQFLYSWYLFTNKSASKFVNTTIGLSSFCVSFAKSIFVCETFSISFFFFLLLVVFFSELMLRKPGFYFLFRSNVYFKTVSGESKAVTSEMLAGWNDTTLPTLLSNYDLENIYNDDEFVVLSMFTRQILSFQNREMFRR